MGLMGVDGMVFEIGTARSQGLFPLIAKRFSIYLCASLSLWSRCCCSLDLPFLQQLGDNHVQSDLLQGWSWSFVHPHQRQKLVLGRPWEPGDNRTRRASSNSGGGFHL